MVGTRHDGCRRRGLVVRSPFCADGGVDDILDTVRHRGPTLDEAIDGPEAERIPHAIRMGHITVCIREYAGNTQGFAEDSQVIRKDSRRIRKRIRKDSRKIRERIRKDSRWIRDGFAEDSRRFASGFARIRGEFAEVHEQIRKHSRWIRESSRRIRESSRRIRESSRRIRESSRRMHNGSKRDCDGYTRVRTELHRYTVVAYGHTCRFWPHHEDQRYPSDENGG